MIPVCSISGGGLSGTPSSPPPLIRASGGKPLTPPFLIKWKVWDNHRVPLRVVHRLTLRVMHRVYYDVMKQFCAGCARALVAVQVNSQLKF